MNNVNEKIQFQVYHNVYVNGRTKIHGRPWNIAWNLTWFTIRHKVRFEVVNHILHQSRDYIRE